MEMCLDIVLIASFLLQGFVRNDKIFDLLLLNSIKAFKQSKCVCLCAFTFVFICDLFKYRPNKKRLMTFKTYL